MNDTEKDEKSEKESSPLKIGPKWYVRCATSHLSLTADRTQPSRCSLGLLPTHQDRKSTTRLLHHVKEGGDGIQYGLHQEVRRGPQHHLDFCASLTTRYCHPPDFPSRLVCSRPSARPLSSTSTRGSNSSPTTILWLSSAPSSSPSTSLRSQTNPPPACSAKPSQRDRHCHGSHVRQPTDLVASSIHCNAGKAMVEPILAECGRVDD